MKRKFRFLIMAAFMVIAPLLMFAQQPPHPNGGFDPGAGNGPVGGGATIGSGLFILLAMGLAYAAHKYYIIRSNTKLEE
jgi:hypothetical protein